MPLHPDADPQTKVLPYIVAFLLISVLLFGVFYLAVISRPPMNAPSGILFA